MSHKEARQELDRRQKLARESDLRRVMATPEGRRVLAWIIYELAGLERSSFLESLKYGVTENGIFSDGKRWVAIQVQHEASRAARPEYRTMVMERLDTEESAAALMADLLEAGNG